MNERYLWDKSGASDPEVARLEALLVRFRHAPTQEPELPAGARRAPAPEVLPAEPAARESRWKRVVVLAVAAAAMVCVWVFLGPEEPRVRGYSVVGEGGASIVRVGDELETGDDRAQMKIAELGHVAVEPRSRVRVEDCGTLAHRLFLEEGAIRARILGEPREFQVGTPSGLTVDLGCEYTLEVAPGGNAILEVFTGQVAFEFEGRSVYVPEGALCLSTPDRGPGWPVFRDATSEFKQAAALLQSQGHFDSIEQEDAFFDGSRDDTLTLWHAFDDPRTSPEIARRAYERLSKIFPKPEGVTDDGLLSGDPSMRAAWMEAMKPSWRTG